MSSTTVVEVKGKSINLPLLQDKMKRHPELYQAEFAICLSVFKELLPELRDSPGKDQPTICSFLIFFTHLYSHFTKDLHFLPNELVNILEQYYSVLHVTTRLTCVKCLMLMRTKNLISPTLYDSDFINHFLRVVPLFVKLFRCDDKKLREMLFGTVVKDIKRLNAHKQNTVGHPANV